MATISILTAFDKRYLSFFSLNRNIIVGVENADGSGTTNSWENPLLLPLRMKVFGPLKAAPILFLLSPEVSGTSGTMSVYIYKSKSLGLKDSSLIKQKQKHKIH